LNNVQNENEMKQPRETKEQIINATIELIQQGKGNIAEITTRAIAKKSKVGTGLVNYHFQSKENLITVCVQRIIEQVVSSFNPHQKEYQSDKERLTDWAIQVFDFLFENYAISRISIVGDLVNYTANCNSIKTQRGFMSALDEKMQKRDKQLLSFMLTSVLQTAFLGNDTCTGLLGYDLSNKPERGRFITRLVSVLYDGFQK